jgi:hypothetical protein
VPAHEFSGAPTYVHHQARPRQVVERRAGRREAPGGLLFPRQNLGTQAKLPLHPIEHCLSVGGVAERTRSGHGDLFGPMVPGGPFVLAQRREEPVLSGVSNAPIRVHAFAQPHKPLGGVQAAEAVSVALHHEELGGVGADVDGGERHKSDA